MLRQPPSPNLTETVKNELLAEYEQLLAKGIKSDADLAAYEKFFLKLDVYIKENKEDIKKIMNTKDAHGKTLLHYLAIPYPGATSVSATQIGMTQDMLSNYGADPYIQDRAGISAVTYNKNILVIIQNNPEIIIESQKNKEIIREKTETLEKRDAAIKAMQERLHPTEKQEEKQQPSQAEIVQRNMNEKKREQLKEEAKKLKEEAERLASPARPKPLPKAPIAERNMWDKLKDPNTDSNALFNFFSNNKHLLNKVDGAGNTPLHYLVQNTGKDREGLVRSLIETGADPTRPNVKNKSPYELANEEMKTVIKDQLATNKGSTPMDTKKIQWHKQIVSKELGITYTPPADTSAKNDKKVYTNPTNDKYDKFRAFGHSAKNWLTHQAKNIKKTVVEKINENKRRP